MIGLGDVTSDVDLCSSGDTGCFRDLPVMFVRPFVDMAQDALSRVPPVPAAVINVENVLAIVLLVSWFGYLARGYRTRSSVGSRRERGGT